MNRPSSKGLRLVITAVISALITAFTIRLASVAECPSRSSRWTVFSARFVILKYCVSCIGLSRTGGCVTATVLVILMAGTATYEMQVVHYKALNRSFGQQACLRHGPALRRLQATVQGRLAPSFLLCVYGGPDAISIEILKNETHPCFIWGSYYAT